MDNLEEKKEQNEVAGLKVKIQYGTQKLGFDIKNPTQSIALIMDALKKEAREKAKWDMPEMLPSGGRIRYFLGRIVDGKEEILRKRNYENGREMCLHDYNVKDGDLLYVFQAICQP